MKTKGKKVSLAFSFRISVVSSQTGGHSSVHLCGWVSAVSGGFLQAWVWNLVHYVWSAPAFLAQAECFSKLIFFKFAAFNYMLQMFVFLNYDSPQNHLVPPPSSSPFVCWINKVCPIEAALRQSLSEDEYSIQAEIADFESLWIHTHSSIQLYH